MIPAPDVKTMIEQCYAVACTKPWTQHNAYEKQVCDSHGLPPNQRAVCLYLVQDGLVLGITRGHAPSAANDWGLPGGKVEATDTDDVQAAARELREETGYVLDVSSAVPIFTKKVHRYTCTTYTGRIRDRVPYDGREGVVSWIPPKWLLNPACTFVGYNTELLRRIGGLRYGA